jgi:hypothetical protein
VIDQSDFPFEKQDDSRISKLLGIKIDSGDENGEMNRPFLRMTLRFETRHSLFQFCWGADVV